ncbi:hypothetical protein AWM79_04920 [Pseudomonas agarici]|uniref:DUF3203 domain-containing protein n=1 Tax=Pseudomonas agarici TaxID=46677 RepID=A0A0X1SXV6_PSEAA|nr:DUF3203 family protein [Pseudomonas agarici]AMB84682.1 hypothetical protein AWM79_04920 [Pseudomonas agarici]NWB92554.1 DUF3203 family protein [Pseudomonas agarici]NWC07619.1 DUF3203 family protein [Pseudomonas agarici]SEL05802.1 Protein of unknown function [Pseudomonas agarici]
MPIKIDRSNQTCTLEEHDTCVHGLAKNVRITTDDAKSMSRAELNGKAIWITEAEADALTGAGAVDGRHHVKVTSNQSVI